MAENRAGPIRDDNECRHGVAGGCPRCHFGDDLFAKFYAGTTIPRTPPSEVEIRQASEDVWTRAPLRRFTERGR